MATDYSPLDLLIAGLLSHGFKELGPAESVSGYRRFQRFGRDDRWVRERDCQLILGNAVWEEDILVIPDDSDQHRLLRKCGMIWLRTRERAEYKLLAKREPQRSLFDVDKALGEL